MKSISNENILIKLTKRRKGGGGLIQPNTQSNNISYMSAAAKKAFHRTCVSLVCFFCGSGTEVENP